MSETTFPAFASTRRLPNLVDIAAMLVIFAAIVGVGTVARHLGAALPANQVASIHLDPSYLPGYAVRTTLRMFAALAASLFFTFTFGTAAAKSRRAGLVLVPLLDILQSVPVLGFLTFTVTFFMNLFPGRVLGAELAAIFAIFTSQAWNMAFSMYQSLKTIPADLDEASRGFRLTAWQRFWRLEVPFAMPGLVWNTMLSMSGGWFFVVASEAISVGDTTFRLPGIGSYVQTALDAGDLRAIGYAILAMGVVILAYDQLLFRPLVAWSAKFRFETTQAATAEDPWVLALLRRTQLLRWCGDRVAGFFHLVAAMRLAPSTAHRRARRDENTQRVRSRALDIALLGALALVTAFALWRVALFCAASLRWADVGTVALLGCCTLLRVVLMVILAGLIWVPIGVWLGLRPRWTQRSQAVVQFLAAFPANLFFPIFVLTIVHYQLNVEIWLTPLMILGTQWYILFNVIAGASAFPGDLREAARNFRVGGTLWWRRVILPGIFPYFVTGAITASGGCWNAAIVSEVASWRGTQLHATGLGAYIADATASTAPDASAKVVLGVITMSIFVLSFNRLLWRPMYAYSMRRLTL